MIDFAAFRKAIDRKNAALFAVERIRSRATRITSTITGQPRGASVGKQVEDGAIRILEAEEALAARKTELEAYKKQLLESMPKLTDERQVKFIQLRYLEEKSVPTIAIRESYSESLVYEELGKAEKILNSGGAGD